MTKSQKTERPTHLQQIAPTKRQQQQTNKQTKTMSSHILMIPSSSSTSSTSFYTSILSTFVASIRSVGTACTLAIVGIYLHRNNYVIGDGKRTLALISQQVTIPLFLFTKIIYCNQDWSTDPCPDITQSLEDVWMLLLWPIYVVFVGFLIGMLISKLCNTPTKQIRSVLACCMFGNSTGLPITLLTVVHANFPSTSDLGRIDPCLFLSVYLLLYPILQWSIGGWLLAPEDDEEEEEEDGLDEVEVADVANGDAVTAAVGSSAAIELPPTEIMVSTTEEATTTATTTPTHARKLSAGMAHNVLNNRAMEQWYKFSRRGMNETDASLYMSVQENLYQYGYTNIMEPTSTSSNGAAGGEAFTSNMYGATTTTNNEEDNIGMDIGDSNSGSDEDNNDGIDHIVSVGNLSSMTPRIANGPATLGARGGGGGTNNDDEMAALLPKYHNNNNGAHPFTIVESGRSGAGGLISRHQRRTSEGIGSVISKDTTVKSIYEKETIYETLSKVLKRCLQPPVVGAILGMVVASIPDLRGLFVDLIDRSDDAPLEWFFDGLYAVGQAAVPINMMILGCNLSASYQLQQQQQQNSMQKADTSISNNDPKANAAMANKFLSKKTMMGTYDACSFWLVCVSFSSILLSVLTINMFGCSSLACYSHIYPPDRRCFG